MINLRANTYLFLAGTVLVLLIAVLCSLAANSMDVFFWGAAILLGAMTVNSFKKFRNEKKSRLY